MNQRAPELAAVADFVRHCLPFDQLDETQLALAARSMEVTYVPAGTALDADNAPGLSLLRSGAVDFHDNNGDLLQRLAEGQHFHLEQLRDLWPGLRASVLEDALLYQLPEGDWRELRRQNPCFDAGFGQGRVRNLQPATPAGPGDPLLQQCVSDLIHRQPECLRPDQSVAEAARLMDRERISSVLVVADGPLLGIVTDRDLRSRVLAAGRSGDAPLAEIMSKGLKTLALDASLFDAMLLMTEHNLHHLPVVDSRQRPIAMLTSTDLLKARGNNPIFLAQRLAHARDVNAVRDIVERLPRLLVQWHGGGASGLQVSRMLTTISDAVTRRLLVLAEQELGPPPVPYAWLGFGSQGRAEQALGADQDNALVYSNDCTETQVDYFQQLAERVCRQLDYCGYSLCRGDIMASNPRWRLPLQRWQQTVRAWTLEPTPKAVMHVSIFFDIRAIHGDATLAAALQQTMLDSAAGNDIFLAALTHNALEHRPPLGFFRRFVVEHSGEHQSALDLKLRGIIPVVDLCRIYALANRITAVNTEERLQRMRQDNVISPVDADDLRDAFTFICQQRVDLQARQVAAQRSTDNFLIPSDLHHLAREQLRDAFDIVRRTQQALQVHFLRSGLF